MGLQKILSLLEAEDYDVRIHAVKVVANLAAEGTKNKKHFNVHCLSDIIALPRSFLAFSSYFHYSDSHKAGTRLILKCLLQCHLLI